MIRRKPWPGRFFLLIPALGLCVLVLVFFLRAPVVLVSDAAFESLYGGRRVLQSRVSSSLALFRPVRVVSVADSAGPEMAAFAVEAAVSRPYCVLFPNRYAEGARRYTRDYPQIPVVVLEGRRRELSREEGLRYAATDLVIDLYRAGRCAAFFAAPQGRVLFFQDEPLDPAGREAFVRGLKGGGWEGSPLYLNAGTEYTAFDDISCVLVMGSPSFFLERNLDIPVILFSWINPALTSSRVKLIFDDSPWALLVPVVKTLGRHPEKINTIPSKISLVAPRIKEKEALRSLRELTALENSPEGAETPE
jgi:hypothetical protein